VGDIKMKKDILERILLWVFLGLLMISSCAFQGQAQDLTQTDTTERLSRPVVAVTYPEAFIVGEAYPKWSAGYLIAYRRDTALSDTEANLRIYDGKGKLVTQTRLWIEGASLLRIKDIAASHDGRLAVVGVAIDASGSFAAFLADISLRGEPRARVVHTSPFEGQSVAFGPDGSFWLVGYVMGTFRSSKEGPDHFIVQHLGTDDVLKGEYVMRSSLQCAQHPASGQPKILTSDDRIGLFLPVCHSWVELKPDGELIGVWRWNETVPAIAGSNAGQRRVINQVALMPNNELYARIELPDSQLYRFNRKKSDWVPVETDATREADLPFGVLQGSEDDKLVFCAKNMVVWAKPSSPTD
jgi:hypothetical protein